MKGKGKILFFFLCLFLTYYGVFTINYIVNLKTNNNIFSYSLLSIFLFVFLFMINRFSLCKFNRRSILLSAIGGIFFAFCEIIGSNIDVTYHLPYISFQLIAAFLGAFIIGAACINIILSNYFELCTSLHNVLPRNSINIKAKFGRVYHSNTYHLLIVWLIIFICWLPCFIASFPGVFAYDAPHQFTQFYTGTIANNQPVFSSAVLYLIISLGIKIFGSFDGGVALFIIIQMIFGSFTLAYSCLFMKKIKAPIVIEFAAILLYALFPVNHLFAVNTTKDVYFSYFVLNIIIILLDIVCNKKKFILSRKNQILFSVLILLTLFYRNNGSYIFVLFIPAFFILLGRKKWKLTLILVLVCLLPYKFVTSYVYDYLHIPSSYLSEAFPIPAQQMVNAYVTHANTFTEEEKETFLNLFGPGTQEQYKLKYHPRSSDYTRSAFMKLPDHYISLYIKLGKEYPKSYIEALLNNTLGYWYPQLHLPDENAQPQKYIEYSNSTYPGIAVMSNRYNFLPTLSKIYEGIGNYGTYNKIPVLSMLFSIGFYTLIYFVIILLAIYRKRYKLLIPLWYLLVLWLSSFAGPVVLLRYVYSIFLCLPVFIAFIVSEEQLNK